LRKAAKYSEYMIPVGFEVLTAVVMKRSDYLTPCSTLKVSPCLLLLLLFISSIAVENF
jgi:hypothetical protein